MCTGRVDLAFVLRAYRQGADGVIIGGCWPGECHYVTEGNYDALGNMYLGKSTPGACVWNGSPPPRGPALPRS
jgi:coenzyme F420-reducing hydrogenase delta subunit